MSREDLADDMPKLLGARGTQVRPPLEALPVLSISHLTSSAELRRAQLLLALFAHSYVWCSNNSSTSIALPKGVAIPLWEVSVALDIPPVLTQLTIVLSNYRLLDSDASVCMENLATLVNFFGGRDESWFYLVTAEVEASGAKAIMPLLLLQHAIEQHQDTHGEDAALLDVAAGYLATSASAIKVSFSVISATYNVPQDMVTSFKKVREACHPVIFYQRCKLYFFVSLLMT